ncbi:NAD(P)/FAD-dependent oxidoreductase [Agrobacterium larrymoorei]|uniref:Thioredoxin reductase n=1 Tax=Agrobacterium larrymoorei TaxID=160699 RepID=A0ABU0UII6_9HYPH|nr:NAD(P)/FAD-dependent oxidoreductase [Agrobacterium larrymoorei]MDQ1184741.1 thioredoxin reductase [Agrobacterium larrymoorei]
MTYDVIIIGGSYAGLSAALQLGRARRRILVIDAGNRRNRFASHSHGFLGQDGKAPGEIVAEARRQIEAYVTIDWIDSLATNVSGAFDAFEVEIDGGARQTGRRLIIAAGVTDELPPIPGLSERWGQSVFHCPYCHGYELNQGRIGVIATSALAIHHGLMLPDWGTTTLFTNGAFVPDKEQRAQLAARATAVEEVTIQEINGNADIKLTDGRRLAMDGLFTQPKLRISAPWIATLGCSLEETLMGTTIQTDATKQTTKRGVFACGDIARPAGSVALAVGDGAMTGTAAHRSLMFPDL